MLATTWLLVMISPSAVRMMPEPSSDWSPWSVFSVTTLGNTLAATCASGETGTLIADRSTAELGTNNWLPMVGGWIRIVAAVAPIAAENTATARPRRIKVPVSVSLRRPFC
jgi:hypothetical protein